MVFCLSRPVWLRLFCIPRGLGFRVSGRSRAFSSSSSSSSQADVQRESLKEKAFTIWHLWASLRIGTLPSGDTNSWTWLESVAVFSCVLSMRSCDSELWKGVWLFQWNSSQNYTEEEYI
jgi:hypothetical protein